MKKLILAKINIITLVSLGNSELTLLTAA